MSGMITPMLMVVLSLGVSSDPAKLTVCAEQITLNPVSGPAPEQGWQQVLAVYVASNQPKPLPLIGDYALNGTTLQFTPRFPLDAGLKYRVVYQSQGKSQTRSIQLPKPKPGPPAHLTTIYPSGKTIPANVLRFYLHFSAPMQAGNVYRHIHLLRDDGTEIDLPFLELDEELWDRDYQRLTLLIDPGRIKREVKPREDLGPVFEPGRTYSLVVDQDWKDAEGRPLAKSLRKAYRASEPVRTAHSPKRWQITPPPAGTRKPLIVRFPRALDHALTQAMIQVEDDAGRTIDGAIRLAAQEHEWQFTPKAAWLPGAYQLQIDTRLEDVSGNRIDRPFEVDVVRRATRTIDVKTVKRPFQISVR